MSLDTNGAPTAASPTAETEDQGAAQAAAEGVTDANAAESSTAGEDDGAHPAVDLLSVVKDAVKKDDEAEAASPTAEGEGEAKPTGTEAKPEGAAEATQAEADAKLPFHEHPRWKEVIAERDGYKDDAGRFREVTNFMESNSLTGDEVTEGFAVMADLKSGDPARLSKAREYLSSRLTALDDALGNVLPDDLQERVDGGLVDVETAQELAKTRAADRLRTTQAAERERADAQEQTRNQVVARATANATAVDAWDKQQRQSDPDYAKKADLIETTCRAIIQQTGKVPQTPDEAVALCNEALKHVNTRLSGMLPKPKPVRGDPVGSSAKTVSDPKTLRDAIKAAVSG